MRFANQLFLTLLFFTLSLAPASAYIDPGSGSFLVQMLVASAVGAAYYVKTSWYRIKSIFGKGDGKEVEDASKSDVEDESSLETSEEEKV